MFFVDLKATFLLEKFCLRMTRTKFLFNDMHEGKKSMNNGEEWSKAHLGGKQLAELVKN